MARSLDTVSTTRPRRRGPPSPTSTRRTRPRLTYFPEPIHVRSARVTRSHAAYRPFATRSCMVKGGGSPASSRGGARRGANGEQTYALNGSELHSTALNGTAPTCGSYISAGRRIMASLVHTYELFQVCSTDLNCTEPQVNGAEQTRDLLL
jgi:hypothetical protein